MHSAIAQVFATYVRRVLSSHLLAITAFAILFPALLSWRMVIVKEFPGLMMVIAMFMWSIFLWDHFQAMVVGVRLRLCPDFVWPHLVCFAGLSAMSVMLAIALMSQFWNASLLGSIALITGCFAVTGLLILAQSLMLCVSLVLAGSLWTYLGSSVVTLIKIYHGQMDDAALLIAILSLLTIASSLAGFFHLTEESRLYHRGRTGLSGRSVKPKMTGEGNEFWARLPEIQLRFIGGQLPRGSIESDNSRWGSIQRWRYQSSWKLVLFGAYMGGITLFFPWFFVHRMTGASPTVMVDMTFFILFGMVAQQWLQRWRYVETELLRPVNRDRFFKQLGIAIMFDFAVALAVSLAVMVMPALLWKHDRSQLFPLLTNGLLYVSGVVFMFGFSVWMIQFRSVYKMALGQMIALPFVLLPMLPGGPMHNIAYLPWFLLGLCAIALMGIGLGLRAYRSWLEIDLG